LIPSNIVTILTTYLDGKEFRFPSKLPFPIAARRFALYLPLTALREQAD
jgi:hypothetical protein